MSTNTHNTTKRTKTVIFAVLLSIFIIGIKYYFYQPYILDVEEHPIIAGYSLVTMFYLLGLEFLQFTVFLALIKYLNKYKVLYLTLSRTNLIYILLLDIINELNNLNDEE